MNSNKQQVEVEESKKENYFSLLVDNTSRTQAQS